ncbi:MAG TPA: DNA replication/repair protein RecF [Cytophagaceae bacterium]|jgi:DNA replication and repair protein RecF|nr:DNA replication/repair protein RecF [Cytophagaceae bacterium]
MYLENINLLNFKNYEELSLSFSEQVNFFMGANGSGKTNLLDAIYYLSLSKSAFNSNDSQNIKTGADFFMLSGSFIKDSKTSLVQASFAKGQKKVLKINKNPYEKLSEHIGEFPVVLIAPNDTDIIREGGEFRRKFFDGILAQLSHAYLNELIKYNHLLKQRNSLLKQFSERNHTDQDLVDTYDVQIISAAKFIYGERKKFLDEFVPVFTNHYQNLSEEKEETSLSYTSQLESTDFEKEYRQALKRDIILQRTTYGIHRDDFIFKIGEHPLKSYGSQGQQKSFVIALKLAQFDIIKKQKGFKPILLLDDIFDKLDDHRISKLMEMVAGHSFGQLFITDARAGRSEKLFAQIKAEVKVWRVEQGKIV